MSDDQDLVAILQTALAAFNKNDLDALAAYVAADVTYTIRGRAAVSGTYRGISGFRSALSKIKDLTGGTMQIQPEVVLADQHTIMTYSRVTGTRSDGRSYHSHQADLYRFRDGKIIEGQSIPAEQHAFQQFFQD